VAGEDVQLAKDIPGIDLVISGHSHTELNEAIVVNGRTPVVQAGKESNNLGELTKVTVSLKPMPLTAQDQRKLAQGIAAAALAAR
jgi:2',3'-cyclic-nucleotide 2'-phosphodiesterase (5'-nucleotidase family)